VMRSLISVLPVVSMDSDDMTCIGLVLTAFGAAMREPVTMISCRVLGSSDFRLLLRESGHAGCSGQDPTKKLRFPSGKKMNARFLHSETNTPHVEGLPKGNGHDVSDQKRAFVAGSQPSVSCQSFVVQKYRRAI